MQPMNVSPKRVLHVFRAMNCGGAETAMMNVYREIRNLGVQFDFAVMTQEPAFYDAEISHLGGRILPLPDPKISGIRAFRRALKQTLISAGPFLAVHSHVHHFSGLVLRTAHQSSIPVRVAHSHTVEGEGAKHLKRAAYRWLMKATIRRHATHLLGASLDASVDLFGVAAKRGLQGRILPNGIDLSSYANLDRQRSTARRELGMNSGELLVGHVGRFEPVKNHAFAVRTFYELLQKAPSARLILIGDGPLRSSIEEYVRRLGIEYLVTFMGLCSNVPRALAALDVFLFPSVREGLGLAFVEAQAAGVPCLGSSSLPREADLGIGLAAFQDLDDGPSAWAASAFALAGIPRPDWTRRKEALRNRGYDIRSVAQELAYTYCSTCEAQPTEAMSYAHQGEF